jgi:hypothetical protein
LNAAKNICTSKSNEIFPFKHIGYNPIFLNPNPHGFIAKPKPLLVAEKSHYYPTPCSAL